MKADMDGLIMFAEYAFPPNFLQFCGPADSKALFEILMKNEPSDVKELKNLLLQFQGAVPYLRLIAEANVIKDIFDKRVVEAYWLGNPLLKKVEAKDIHGHAEARFKKNMKAKDWQWLVKKSIPEAKPFHCFHVFDICRKTDISRLKNKEKLLETMDKCRIGWGRVESLEFSAGNKNLYSGVALVNWEPLEFKEGKLKFAKTEIRKAFFLKSNIRKGDRVSLHWDYICNKITPAQEMNLKYWTGYHLKLANQTF